MERKSARLYFIDAMRAWAILMMLQGHFVDGLLDMGFRNNSAEGYTIWKYFRGITAPVFFTVSGFIFTYLLVRVPQTGFNNPRIKKGVKRGLQLLLIGYLLRLNLFGLLQGHIYDAFYLVDVLHCIGLSILGIIGLYLLTYRQERWLFPAVLATITVLLFLFEPWYKQFTYSFLPDALANYFSKTNGSVFTIFPWFGYTAFGGFLSLLFTRFRDLKYLYPTAIAAAIAIGSLLIFYSSDFFFSISKYTDIQLFADIYFNNYLFIRLGDVFLVFAVFMLFRSLLTHKTLIKIGQSTLSIYVIHFIILYGSFTGLGLYRFFHHSLTPQVVIPSALIFMIICTYTALLYERHKATLKSNLVSAMGYVWTKVEPLYFSAHKVVRASLARLLRLFGLVKN
ncbi:acyltransferase family protein [Ulvibacterium sp.]|uniref:acyltransferase family protein n=1 Tax=Ulvibacterium sp. TaxID=2665914 RepID=UPI003BABE20B